ncbi:hydroxyacid dehydrogenase [Streptomyces sp. NPDC007100]|uniref:hydroxyacid dehydrogenase n=1 Tax=Streptomyces sp. NPDC007100 TaxID=3155602 RepID=UPI00340F4802
MTDPYPEEAPAVPQPVILVADPLDEGVTADLAADFDLRHCEGADRSALLTAIPQAAALIVRSATQVDQEIIDAAPALRVVARAGVGLDNIDVPAATRAGVKVVNAPESNVVSVAELAVGLILSSLRHIPAASASVRRGEWRRSAFQGEELCGKTVGVLGFGRIGRLVAARLAPFDVELLANDPHIPDSAMAELGVTGAPFETLMRRSDILTVHLPRTPETIGIVSHEALRLARPTLRVVNTSRGGIVDESALEVALKEGRIAGAALDVFAMEPPAADSPLLGDTAVLPTPHIGAGTRQAQLRAASEIATAVRRILLPTSTRTVVRGCSV